MCVCINIYIYIYIFFFWLYYTSCGILVPQSGIKPTCPALETWSLNHWSAREVPIIFIFNDIWEWKHRYLFNALDIKVSIMIHLSRRSLSSSSSALALITSGRCWAEAGWRWCGIPDVPSTSCEVFGSLLISLGHRVPICTMTFNPKIDLRGLVRRLKG